MSIDKELDLMFQDFLDAHEARCARGNYYPWGRLQTYSAMTFAVECAQRLRQEAAVVVPIEEKEITEWKDEEIKSK